MERRTKVLHVVGRRPKGGIGTFLINMHSNMDTSKVTFDYLINAAAPTGEFDQKVRNLGGNVYVLPELSYKNALKYLSELNNFFQEHYDYDVIHVHSVNIGFFNFLQARRYGIKHRIAHSHNTKHSDNVIRGIRNFFLQLPVKKLANIYFACGEEAGSFLFGKKCVENGQVYIAQNAIDPQKFRFNRQVREKVRSDLDLNGKFVIGHVGAFLPQKNHIFLIDVFNELYKQHNKAMLLLIGIGELEEQIKDKVKRLNLEQSVRFLGTRNDVHELMQAFDVFLLPSLFEGLPLVGIEAQAAGLRCVISDTITKEIMLTDLVKYASLKTTPKEWAHILLSYNDNYRRDTLREIVKAGYEVKGAAIRLQNFYTSLK